MKIKTLFFTVSILFTTLIFSQEKEIKFKIISSDTEEPIENAIVLNMQNNNFVYSDSLGNINLDYRTNIESIKIIIPSYFDKRISINEILENNNIIKLKTKEYILNEIVLVKKSNTKSNKNLLKLKCKNKYYTEHISAGGSIASEFFYKKKEPKKIESIAFFIKTEKENIKIRPLLYKVNANNWHQLLETPITLEVNKENEKIEFNIETFNIILNPNEKFIIGFELIDKSDINLTKVLSCSDKNLITYLKAKPDSNWFRLQEKNPNFSIYYEINLID